MNAYMVKHMNEEINKCYLERLSDNFFVSRIQCQEAGLLQDRSTLCIGHPPGHRENT